MASPVPDKTTIAADRIGTGTDTLDGSGNGTVLAFLRAQLLATTAGAGTVSINQTTPGTTNGVVVNSSALPTGAATAANQTTMDGHLTNVQAAAGSSATAAQAVQGLAGGLPLSANLSQVNGGAIATGNGVSNAQTQRVTISSDSTVGVEGVDGATQASATNPLPVGDSGVADGVVGTSAALGSATQFAFASGLPVQVGSSNQNIVTTGYGSFFLQVIANVSANTFLVEGSVDGGTTWTTIPIKNFGSSAGSVSSSVNSAGGIAFDAAYTLPLMRVRMSVFVGGTTTVAVALKRAVSPNVVDAFVGNTVTTNTVLNAQAVTGGISAVGRIISAATTNATSFKASAGRAYGYRAANNSASWRYLKLYNKASAPTVGTDVPVETIGVPPGGVVAEMTDIGSYFSLGIAAAITANPADADSTAIGANEVIVSVKYV